MAHPSMPTSLQINFSDNLQSASGSVDSVLRSLIELRDAMQGSNEAACAKGSCEQVSLPLIGALNKFPDEIIGTTDKCKEVVGEIRNMLKL